jgi:hypothetical protein
VYAIIELANDGIGNRAMICTEVGAGDRATLSDNLPKREKDGIISVRVAECVMRGLGKLPGLNLVHQLELDCGVVDRIREVSGNDRKLADESAMSNALVGPLKTCRVDYAGIVFD